MFGCSHHRHLVDLHATLGCTSSRDHASPTTTLPQLYRVERYIEPDNDPQPRCASTRRSADDGVRCAFTPRCARVEPEITVWCEPRRAVSHGGPRPATVDAQDGRQRGITGAISAAAMEKYATRTMPTARSRYPITLIWRRVGVAADLVLVFSTMRTARRSRPDPRKPNPRKRTSPSTSPSPASDEHRTPDAAAIHPHARSER